METPREVIDAVREQLAQLGCDVECSDELIVDFLKHLARKLLPSSPCTLSRPQDAPPQPRDEALFLNRPCDL